MPLIFKDSLFDAQWLRAAGHGSYGGAEIGECFLAARAIRETGAESWLKAWKTLADDALAKAKASHDGGHSVSARGAYMRASNYYRAAYTFLLSKKADPRLRELYRSHRDAFEAAAALMEPQAERIAIPYEGKTMRGWFFRAGNDNAARPTLIVNGGYDSTAEECYLFSAAAALERGYNAITFDGPGQGGAIIEDGIVFRPDWEKVIGPVVDYALTRPDVDASKLALMGISFGGYLAPRGASGEPRIAALIADPGEYSLFDELKSRMPGFVARQLPDGKSLGMTLTRFMLRMRLRNTTEGWGLRRALYVHGVKGPMDYIRLTQAYTLEGRTGQIRCPTLICSAENDDIGVTARSLYDALTCEKAFIAFSAKDAAGGHCEAGARTWFNQQAFDWLDGVLKVAKRA